MYGLSVEEKDLYLTKTVSDDAVITLATFVVPFGSSKSEVFELAKEMVGVLNRDLENRGNDIAHSFNAATCDRVNGIPFSDCPGCEVCDSGKGRVGESPPWCCDNPHCACHDASIGPAIIHNTMPNASDPCDNPQCCDPNTGKKIEPEGVMTFKPDNWKPLSERDQAPEWPIDPETGTPKVEQVGEVHDFPEPGVAHPEGCLCRECDPPIKEVEVDA